MKSSWSDVALFSMWLEEKKNLSDGTITMYTAAIREFLTKDPDIDVLDSYNDYIVRKAVKKRCELVFSAVRAYIEFKQMDAGVKRQLLDGLIRPKKHKDIKRVRKHLTEEETMELINNLSEKKHRIIAIIQSITGVRAGDIMRLKRDNIFPEEYEGKPTLRLNLTAKGRKANVVFIHDDIAQQIILDYITNVTGDDGYYFLERTPRMRKNNTEFSLYFVNYIHYNNDIKLALEKMGIKREDFATHDFRRGFARRVWEKYKDLTVLQKMLNHTDPKDTMKYLQHSGLQNIDYYYDMQK